MKNHLGEEDKMITWIFFEQGNETNPQFEVEAMFSKDAYEIAYEKYGPQVDDLYYKPKYNISEAQLINKCKEFVKDMNIDNKKVINPEWTKPIDDTIDVPDELMPLFNKVGMQVKLMTISGKNEVQTIADIVELSRKFFKDKLNLLE